MKVFVIHRSTDRKQARKVLGLFAKKISAELQLTLLSRSTGSLWQQEAEDEMQKAEIVVIFNPASCQDSDNTTWEITRAKELGKELIELSRDADNAKAFERLEALYDLKEEFESCFTSSMDNILDLYKVMVGSSEELIQRRQRTNAFFITVIGSLLAIAGLLVKTGAVGKNSIGVLYGFSIVGLLLCNSWRNLIGNYGKLNKAKFDVILRLEKNLAAKIYSAEWVALGKGLRPRKYESFTSTEKNVPLYFAALIFVLTLIGVFWKIWLS